MRTNFTFLILVVMIISCKKGKEVPGASSFLVGEVYRKVSLDADGLPYAIREIRFSSSSQLIFTNKNIWAGDTIVKGPVEIMYTYDPGSSLIVYSSNPPVFYKYAVDSLVKLVIIPPDTFDGYQTLYRVK